MFHKSKGVARKCIGIVGTAHTILVNYLHYHPRYPPKLDHGAFCVRRQFFLLRAVPGPGVCCTFGATIFRLASGFLISAPPRPFLVSASGVCTFCPTILCFLTLNPVHKYNFCETMVCYEQGGGSTTIYCQDIASTHFFTLFKNV